MLTTSNKKLLSTLHTQSLSISQFTFAGPAMQAVFGKVAICYEWTRVKAVRFASSPILTDFRVSHFTNINILSNKINLLAQKMKTSNDAFV